MLRAAHPPRARAPGALERIGGDFLDYLKKRLPVTDEQIYYTSAPLRLDYAFSLAAKLPEELRRSLTYPEFKPCRTAGIRAGESMIRQIGRADRLLSFPFESMDPFLRLLKRGRRGPGRHLDKDNHLPPRQPGQAGRIPLRRRRERQGRHRLHRAAREVRRAEQHRLVRAAGGRGLHGVLRL